MTLLPRKRARHNTNGLGYLERFDAPPANSAIIFVHGLFGDYLETWGNSPTGLVKQKILNEMDVGSFGYQTNIINLAKPDDVVQQFLLWAKAWLLEYENLFFVAHSLGGLVLRHALATELAAGDDEIVSRTRRCFLVASPVSGASLASRMATFFGKANTWLEYLANPKLDGKTLDVAYREQMDAYKKRMDDAGRYGRRPTCHLFTGIDDNVVLAPTKWNTGLDRYEGVLQGDHKSLKAGLTGNSTLVARIACLVQRSFDETNQIQLIDVVKETNAARAKAQQDGAVDLATTQRQPEAYDVIVISCSNQKASAPGLAYSDDGAIARCISDNRVGEWALRRRAKIRALIQAGQIEGIEFAEGNRAAKVINTALVHGPDFGGPTLEDRYLPAFRRYSGRAYQTPEADWQKLFQQASRPQILIMSGLYGLLPANEFIQNYDCHITDVDLDSSISIQSYWRDRELMTEMLVAHLDWLEKNKGPIAKVVDLLSELSYQETIHWPMLYPRWPVLHRVFERHAGRDALGNMGIWLRDRIRDGAPAVVLEENKFYENKNFIKPDAIAFETRIGSSTLKVTREVPV